MKQNIGSELYQIIMYTMYLARTIKLEAHLTVDELYQRYKTTADAPTARRWQALWLIAQGATAKAAGVVG